MYIKWNGCHVVELKGEYGWMPYTVTGDLSNAIIAILKLYNEKKLKPI